MAFVFSAFILSLALPFAPDLLLLLRKDDLFLSFSLSTRPACLNFETRPCRERKRRYKPCVSRLASVYAYYVLPSRWSLFRPSRVFEALGGPVSDHISHIRYPRRKRCITTCASLSLSLFLHSLLLAETNCSRVLQPFRGEGRTRICTVYAPYTVESFILGGNMHIQRVR